MVDQKLVSLANIGTKLAQVAPAGKAIFRASPEFVEGLRTAHAAGHSPAAIAKLVKVDLKAAGLPALTGDDVADLLGIEKHPPKPRATKAGEKTGQADTNAVYSVALELIGDADKTMSDAIYQSGLDPTDNNPLRWKTPTETPLPNADAEALRATVAKIVGKNGTVSIVKLVS